MAWVPPWEQALPGEAGEPGDFLEEGLAWAWELDPEPVHRLAAPRECAPMAR